MMSQPCQVVQAYDRAPIEEIPCDDAAGLENNFMHGQFDRHRIRASTARRERRHADGRAP